MVVLVTGASGQLGKSLQIIAMNHPKIEFVFCDSKALDIANKENCQEVFSKIKPQFCINTAAYTAVDKAECEPEKAHLINVIGARNIAEVCKEYNTILLHISTDFVFDGSSTALGMTNGYTEEDLPNPICVYGDTKLKGEQAIQAVLKEYFIIRTSWLYSQFGNNFMKTMIRLGNERETLSVVNDQIGTPTNAADLAEVLIKIICHTERSRSAKITTQYGIYNFSNEGQCSWYDFAKKIFEINKIEINLQSISTSSYPTPARRPKYSVLDKSKIKTVFGLKIKYWKKSIKSI